MAQLASCPHCESEFVLPEPTLPPIGTTAPWGQCPSCNRSFALADVAIRPLPEVAIVPAPSVDDLGSIDGGSLSRSVADAQDHPPETDHPEAEHPETDNAEDKRKADKVGDDNVGDIAEPSPVEEAEKSARSPSIGDAAIPLAGAFGGSTLASFLRDRKEPRTSNDPQETDAPIENNPLDPSAETTQEEAAGPSPSLDRLGATSGNVFDFGKETSVDSVDVPADNALSDADSLDNGSDGAKTIEREPSGFDSFTSSLADLEEPSKATSAPEPPSFDFEVEGGTEGVAAGSVSPTFDIDSPFTMNNATDETVDKLSFNFSAEETGEEKNLHLAPQVNIGSEEITGHVAIRRRKSGGKSMLRQLAGVAGGGAMGLGMGYWLLLWILHWTGRTDDPLSIANFYPNAIKPATFQSGGDPRATSDADSAARRVEPLAAKRWEESPLEESPRSGNALSPRDSAGSVGLATFEQSMEPAAPTETERDRLGLTPVQVSGLTTYRAAQVRELTQVGPLAAKGLLGGSFSDPATRPAKGRGYAKLADLAHAIALAEEKTGAMWKQEAMEVFPPLFKLERHREEIATIAGYWWESNKRPHGGIFFSGVIDNGVQQGSVMEYNVLLPTGQELKVLTRGALPEEARSAEAVGLVGVGLENPVTHLEGYTGSPTMAVWANDFFPIDRRAENPQ